ncbi:hypothetical protein [Acrocarpospora sp. B8E8]|uniref:FIMAH domain-containing protein n=1 Tax=Acrocarpospora sp. B8E8 TaxID=3153572 RepID=UPI00325E4093
MAKQLLGGQATRIYCLSVLRSIDRPGTPRHIVAAPSLPDGSVNPAAFNEEGFRILDRILATANEAGVRVVIPITNQFPWHGGYTDLAALRGVDPSQYWTNQTTRADFKAILTYTLNRVNTITGVAYKDDKAVLAWAYGNELNSATDTWITEMGSHLRSIDHNHLIMHHTTRGNIRASDLANPYVDVVATSIYDNFNNITVQRIINQKDQTAGIKPYVTFEFGFSTTEILGNIMDTIISTGASGGQLWGLRPHNRDGGFYWHGEEGSGSFFLLRSYHWPGFPSGDRYDESSVMNLLRTKAYAIQGIDPPAIKAPAPPTLLPISSPSAISWQGSVGARSYVLQRATSPHGKWTVVNPEVYDDVAYTSIYNDTSVTLGERYYYRVRARDEAGLSPPSNVVGPVRATSLSIVDDLADLSQTFQHTGNLDTQTTNNRVFSERLARVARTTAAADQSLVYRIAGNPLSTRAFTYFQNLDGDFLLSVSRDGTDFTPATANVARFGEGPGVYGYWYRVRYDLARLPVDTRYLKITFPGLANSLTPQLDRVEIPYLPVSVATIKDVVRHYATTGELSAKTAARLTDDLKQAEQRLDHDGPAKAIKKLEEFQRHLADVTAAAAELLNNDATLLIATLRAE